MARYALVSNGNVINIITWDGMQKIDFGKGVLAIAAADDVQIGYAYDGEHFIAPAPEVSNETLAACKTRLSDSIDTLVASIYSNWTRFEQEYLLREQAARVFKDAGYEGDPGPWVSAFADAAGMSNTEAADRILAQSVSLNAALVSLGALRMRKYEVLKAANADDANAAYVNVVAAINAVAATIQ
jgi:hypothetical protein